jgi:hypothetical protein
MVRCVRLGHCTLGPLWGGGRWRGGAGSREHVPSRRCWYSLPFETLFCDHRDLSPPHHTRSDGQLLDNTWKATTSHSCHETYGLRHTAFRCRLRCQLSTAALTRSRGCPCYQPTTAESRVRGASRLRCYPPRDCYSPRDFILLGVIILRGVVILLGVVILQGVVILLGTDGEVHAASTMFAA